MFWNMDIKSFIYRGQGFWGIWYRSLMRKMMIEWFWRILQTEDFKCKVLDEIYSDRIHLLWLFFMSPTADVYLTDAGHDRYTYDFIYVFLFQIVLNDTNKWIGFIDTSSSYLSKVLVFGLYFGPCQIKLIMKAFKKLITEVAKQFFIVHLKALGNFFSPPIKTMCNYNSQVTLSLWTKAI